MLKTIKNEELAFLIGRITLGINFVGHGIVRLPKLDAFCNGMVKGMEGTLLDFEPLIYYYSLILVFVEFIVGLTLILGYKTKVSLIIVSLIMMSLIFGACMQEEWPRVGFQMIYVVFVFMMMRGFTETKYSLDYVFGKANS